MSAQHAETGGLYRQTDSAPERVDVGEMIERVAKALFDDLNDTAPERVRYPWSEANIAVRAAYWSRARAAIAAMREPTEEMKQTIDRLLPDDSEWDFRAEPYATGQRDIPVWETMIDAALVD